MARRRSRQSVAGVVIIAALVAIARSCGKTPSPRPAREVRQYLPPPSDAATPLAAAGGESLGAPDKSVAYRVSRVVDGDTIVIAMNGAQEKVRLIGVDTPETVHPRKQVQYYGKEASRFTKDLLTGKEVWLEFERGGMSRDRYGRALAYVYRVPDGMFVNAEIIRLGYGHAYTRFPFKYMEEFRRYEREAREAGRGLWGPGGEQ